MSDTSCLLRQPVRAVVATLIGLAAVGAAAAAGRCQRVIVHGESMLPDLQPGDRVLVVPVRRVVMGQIVAVPDPRRPARIMVKRVASVDRAGGTVTVVGDNPPASTDSRAFGPVRLATVLGRVAYRYHPVERAGRLPPFGPGTVLRGRPGPASQR